MNVAEVTPVVLTFNEEPNVGRTLASLEAFPRVVVVDSGSTDGTEKIARSSSNVDWYVRPFDGHVSQWRWALESTGIETAFVLALDADMSVTPELVSEIAAVASAGQVDAGLIPVEYRIRGVALLGSLYPAELRLLRTSTATVAEAGHTQKFVTSGNVLALRNPLVHDDRKALERFVHAQLGYSAREAPLLSTEKRRQTSARIRRLFPFTPIAVWAWAWLRAGGPLRGPAARRYALERLLFEAMLRWRVENDLLEKRSNQRDTPGGHADPGLDRGR